MRGRVVSEDEARRAHRVLQAVWVIASARHEDAVARDVAELGRRLKTDIDSSDWSAAAETIANIHSWLASMAGVVTARMQKAFEP